MRVRSFTVQPLTAEMALQAYPLIQFARGDLSLEDWTDFVRAYTCQPIEAGTFEDAGRGLIALMNALGYLQGLFSYHVREELAEGSVLEVENVVVMDLFKPIAAAEALRRFMHELASRHRCNSLRVVVGQQDAWLRSYFNNLGFHMNKVHYSHPVSQAPVS